MRADRHGNPVSGASPQAMAHFDRAVADFNAYRNDPIAALDDALAEAPDFAMAHLLKGWFVATATEPAAARGAAACLDAAAALPLTDREASHATALRHLLGGNWTNAATALDKHSAAWPHDMPALQIGHLLDFFRANARNLRDRIARALPHWSGDMPGVTFLYGMYAFGLEEAGDYARAEEMGRRAIDGDAADCWAHHAVAHVMEMQGRAQDGIGWMTAREQDWADAANFFQVHNWWHLALFHLDLGQHDDVLRLYDTRVRATPSPIAVDLVDASALLWRMALSGIDVGDRWAGVADAWEAQADGTLYAFNDWHAAMAYLGAGRPEKVDALLHRMREQAGSNEASRWSAEIGVPVIEGFAAFARGDYAAAVERLHPVRFIANAFGGSHAQRDAIDWTLVEAALRGGYTAMAAALAGERLALKPHSPVNRGFMARAAA